jgi:hypothetical protein
MASITSFLTKVASFFDENNKFLTKMTIKTHYINGDNDKNLLYHEFNGRFCVSRVVLVTRLDKALPKQKLLCRTLVLGLLKLQIQNDANELVFCVHI